MSKISKWSNGTSKTLAGVLIVLLLASSGAAYFWNKSVRQSSPDLFWNSLGKAMTTNGITCTIQDTQGDRKSEQEVQLDLRAGSGATSKTTINHKGTTITTEGIATKSAEYIRYTEIRTDQKNASGRPLNFSSVLNVWGKQPTDTAKPTSLYGQTALGGCVLPLASLSKMQAEKHIQELQKGEVFKTNARAVNHESYEGRRMRVFDVTVQPAQYISFMKQFAASSGLKTLDTVNADEYATRKPEDLKIFVDATGKVRAVVYKDSKRTVQLTDYGKRADIEEPTKSIPVEELQKRLQAVR